MFKAKTNNTRIFYNGTMVGLIGCVVTSVTGSATLVSTT